MAAALPSVPRHPPRLRAAVLGRPIAHSLSPALHRAAYAALGLDWEYTAIECDEAGLPALLRRIRGEGGWVGLSLTMPLKLAVLPLLDRVDGPAATLGAVNTVVAARSAELVGYNTDVDGIAHALGRVLGPAAVPARPVVLGAGGTARAALGALARLGVPVVDLVARRPAAAAPLVTLGEALGTRVRVHPWTTGGGSVVPAGADLVLATAPAGATDELAAEPWPADRGLVELLYHPWPTPLAAAALAAGAPVAGGLEVLAAQALGQARLFAAAQSPTHDVGRLDVETLLEAGSAALAAREPGKPGEPGPEAR